MYVDGNGIPLGVVLSGANDHDKTKLLSVLDARIIDRPSSRVLPQHLCLDKGYDFNDIRLSVVRRRYIAHIPYRGEPIISLPPGGRKRARRWVVERTNRWHNLFRRLKIRYELYARNYLGFVQLANAIICYRRARAA